VACREEISGFLRADKNGAARQFLDHQLGAIPATRQEKIRGWA